MLSSDQVPSLLIASGSGCVLSFISIVPLVRNYSLVTVESLDNELKLV